MKYCKNQSSSGGKSRKRPPTPASMSEAERRRRAEDDVVLEQEWRKLLTRRRCEIREELHLQSTSVKTIRRDEQGEININNFLGQQFLMFYKTTKIISPKLGSHAKILRILFG